MEIEAMISDTFEDGYEKARAIAVATLDGYEAAIRALCELEWALARVAGWEPLTSFAEACASLTRDAAAVQLSTARWCLDL
jgi:hypothetical protein